MMMSIPRKAHTSGAVIDNRIRKKLFMRNVPKSDS